MSDAAEYDNVMRDGRPEDRDGNRLDFPAPEPEPWALPAELERFREFLVNTGGNTAEELLQRLERERNLSMTNLPVFVMAVAVQSQVALLRKLHMDGLLVPESAGVAKDWASKGPVFIQPEAIGVFGQGGLFFPGISMVHEVSDGYHTMGELYDHRRALTRALALSLEDAAWRSKAHHPDDDPMFEGYFIIGMDLPGVGTVTYHYKVKHWDEFEGVPVLAHAPKWDGAPPAASVERLLGWAL